MKIRDFFQSYSKDELKMICRSFDISGFAKEDKPGLIELLLQSMNNRTFIMELFESLSNSCLYFISLLVKTGNEETKINDEPSYIPNFSRQAFINNLKKLYTIGTIFIGENQNGNGILMIPEDLEPWIKEFLAENQNLLISELKELIGILQKNP